MARPIISPWVGDRVLDIALDAGLDLPYSCRGGVCCTCRARVLEGEVEMEKNYTLEQAEIDKGFVLTCQAVPRSQRWSSATTTGKAARSASPAQPLAASPSVATDWFIV